MVLVCQGSVAAAAAARAAARLEEAIAGTTALHPLLAAGAANLAAAGISDPISKALFDAGYASEDNFTAPGRTLNYRGDMVTTDIHLWAADCNTLKAIRARTRREQRERQAAARQPALAAS